MSRLMKYFNEVDMNAAMRIAHQMTPLASMSKFGLTPSEQDAVMSGELAQLAGAIGISQDKFGQLPAMEVPQSLAVQ